MDSTFRLSLLIRRSVVALNRGAFEKVVTDTTVITIRRNVNADQRRFQIVPKTPRICWMAGEVVLESKS